MVEAERRKALAAIDAMKKKLLDLGTGNPLISFNDRRLNVLFVRYPSPGDLYNGFASSTKFRAEALDVDEMIAVRKAASPATSATPKSPKAPKDPLDLGNLLQDVSALEGKIVLYNSVQKTYTALKNLNKKAKEMLDERGIKVLYFAFNFIVWKDTDGEHRAPLLLVPAEIERVKGKYFVGEFEDTVIVNPAFRLKLKREGIDLPDFDVSGGYEDYLVAVSKTVRAHGMRLERDAVLALFNYEKLAMYEDIEKHNKEMAAHGVIGDLILGKNMRGTGRIDIDYDSLVEHNVVDADFSQLTAIGYALKGRSFVLQGPPGTGKSQTITNMIAAFLEAGKRVLFVSEKMTALKVVQKKLADAGLGDYCLELHSNKASKKEFIAELHRVAGLSAERSISAEVALIRTERKTAEDKLNRYGKELARYIPELGVTVFDLFGIYTEVLGCADVDFFVSDIDKKGFDQLQAVLDKLGEYAYYCNAGADPDYTSSPWAALKENVDVAKKAPIHSLLRDAHDAAEALTKASKAISGYGFDLVFGDEADMILEFSDAMAGCRIAGDVVFNEKKRKDAIAAIEEYLIAKAESDKLCAETRAIYDDGVTTVDVAAMSARFDNYSIWERMFGKNYKADRVTLEFYMKPGQPKCNFDTICRHLSLLKRRKEAEAKTAAAEAKLSVLGLNAAATAEIDVLRQLDQVIVWHSINTDKLAALIPRELAAARSVFARSAKEIRSNLPSLKKALEGLEAYFDGFSDPLTDIATVEKKAASLLPMTGFETYVAMRDIAIQLKATNDEGFITDAVSKRIAPDQWQGCYKKCFIFQWVKKVIDESPELRTFDADDHNDLVRRFCDKDEETLRASRRDIPQKLNAKREGAPDDQRLELESEANKPRKQSSVKELLKKMTSLIQKLKPCFMMSPLSISTYFKDTAIEFDVVIFDEASQVLPEDALCAIFRGKQVIIVGDSKQMPPCDIFSVGSYDDEEEASVPEAAETEESVLALGAKAMDSIYLKWHYRSKNESLIAFSNARFYEGNLQTFPSNVVSRPDWGVEHVYVPDGVYENNVNAKEAERVVDLVIEHIVQHPDRSLGVVAFGIRQKDAIEERLSLRIAALTDPAEVAAARAFFVDDASEPFFIKNLETVQGDERDTIIFSMGYGKDPSGKFSHNFGLLNRVGGERRLNVAVTRAKYNVKMVTSVRPDEIRATKDSSMGVQMLKAYVAYAASGGVLGVKTGSGAGLIRSVEDDIYDCLVAAGYEVERNVGASKYKVDLAVKRPGSDEYAVAIECDGKDYQDSDSARDRDRLRTAVLVAMGWKVYRIWSPQWIKSRDTEKCKLLNFIQFAII